MISLRFSRQLLGSLPKNTFTIRCFSDSSSLQNKLKIICAAQSIPHPEKKRGEDAFFLSETAFGVADGVGGWRDHGVDPGEFSRTLVENVRKGIHEPVRSKEEMKQKAVEAAETTCKTVKLGSSTLCAVALGMNDQAFFYNIGDSGLYILRYDHPKTNDGEIPKDHSKEWCIHDFTPKQCHNFNFPFQLGKGADNPRHGVSDALDVRPGDLCLVASDGLFDNLWPRDLTELLNTFWKDGLPAEGEKSRKEQLQQMVDAIVGVTFKFSCSNSQSPFENDAREHGYKYQGGKPDDITAVLSLFL